MLIHERTNIAQHRLEDIKESTENNKIEGR